MRACSIRSASGPPRTAPGVGRVVYDPAAGPTTPWPRCKGSLSFDGARAEAPACEQPQSQSENARRTRARIAPSLKEDTPLDQVVGRGGAKLAARKALVKEVAVV